MHPKLNYTYINIPGIKVGHAQNLEAITGVTVILCEDGAVAGVDQRGGGPGTRETDLLKADKSVPKIHAITLAGGSAFGLDAASGVVRYLEERGIGHDTIVAKIPIVPAAVLFDLILGDPNTRPDAEMGYQACLNASTQPPEQGNVGAGTGATAGKLLGIKHATKTGIGTASIELGDGFVVSAIIALNPVGDVIDPSTNQIIAGVRDPENPSQFADALAILKTIPQDHIFSLAMRTNTVIGIVATNALLSKAHANKVAQMAHNGIARTIRPASTMHDGDTLFALSLGDRPADPSIIGAFAAQAVQAAVLNAVHHAAPLGGLPSAASL